MIEVLSRPAEVQARPRFGGSNICSWIGFKHVCYLLEEAVLEQFRLAGLTPRQLFEEQGLCIDIVDTDARILHALHMDDLVRIEIRPATHDAQGELAFALAAFVPRDGHEVKAVVAKLRVVLRRDHWHSRTVDIAPELVPYTVDRIDRAGSALDAGGTPLLGRGELDPDDDDIAKQLVDGRNAVVWKWRIPYFYCHFTDRIQQSGYLRLMEEVVDLFLADRGISIQRMLRTKKWIPVVPQARVRILREALMEEEIYTVYTVDSIFKDVIYTATMDCYILRDGALVHTATGSITHGYAVIENRKDWTLVDFDDSTVAAFRGDHR